jgi:Na+(H+)/acetate symporter ActP
MKKWLKDLFSESSSVSMGRVMAFTSLCIGAYLAIKGQNDCVTIFVASAFAGKCVQKYTELNSK